MHHIGRERRVVGERKARRVIDIWGARDKTLPDKLWLLKYMRETRVLCSCWMCGHIREREGPTIQERRAVGVDG